jgi:hypothetical protein
MVASVGIQLAVWSKELLKGDTPYGEGWADTTSEQMAIYSLMLHQFLNQFEWILDGMIIDLPDGVGAIEVENPLYRPEEAQSPDELGNVAEGNDDLFPF